MPKFDRFQMEALKECLYHSHIHDAIIETLNYDRKKRILTIVAVNPIHHAKINFTFEDVKVVLSISGNEFGSSETILSLTAEEDYSYLQNYTKVCGDCFTESLYLLFQMFSGDELHIVSEWMEYSNTTIEYGRCAGYKIPLFLGGEDGVTNLEDSDMEVYWGVIARIKNRI